MENKEFYVELRGYKISILDKPENEKLIVSILNHLSEVLSSAMGELKPNPNYTNEYVYSLLDYGTFIESESVGELA